MRALLTLLLLAFLIAPSALAHETDWNDLPVRNIYDPTTRENEPIRDYTFWELDALLDNPKFRQWNDLDRVCETMILLYGRPGHACPHVTQAYQYDRYQPPSVRAYVPPGGYYVYPSVPRHYVYTGPPPWAYPPVPPPFWYHHW